MDFSAHMHTQYSYRALVSSVYDGDTCTCDIDLGFGIKLSGQKIRLYGIDTPEIRGDDKENGQKSRDYLKSRVLDKWVTLWTISDKKGKYGRWLGILSLDDVNINQELLDKELAVIYDK